MRSTRAVDDALKRGSDPLLAAKLREAGAARSASHRAQSLDLSSSTSFAAHRANYSSTTRGPPPPPGAGPSQVQSPPTGAHPFPRDQSSLYTSAPRGDGSGADELSLSGLRIN